MANQETPQERVRRRRRFAASLAPLAVLLIVGGFLAAKHGSGVLETVGFLALMQGIGLVAAIVPLAIGYNPLSKD
jgi:hypothetical protein